MVSILPTAISTTQEYCMTQVFSLKLGFRTTILFSKSLKFFFFLFSSWMTRAGIFFSFIVSWCLHQRVNLCSCWLILPCERPYFLFIAYLLWSHHWSILPGSRVDQNLSNVFHHLPAPAVYWKKLTVWRAINQKHYVQTSQQFRTSSDLGRVPQYLLQ